MIPQLTPPTAAYVTIILTTLAALELAGKHSSCYGSSSSSSGSGSAANNRCYYFHACIQFLSEYERLISGGNLSFSDVELTEACIKHDDIMVCVGRSQNLCVVGPSKSGTSAAMSATTGVNAGAAATIDNEADELSRTWNGLNATLSYLCSRDVKSAVLRYNKGCFAQPHFLSSIRKCNKTFHMEKELFAAQHNDDTCGLTKSLLKCLYEKTMLYCQDAVAADIVATAVRLLRQPRLGARRSVPCALDGARATSPSNQLSFVSGFLLIAVRLLTDV